MIIRRNSIVKLVCFWYLDLPIDIELVDVSVRKGSIIIIEVINLMILEK
jgi:hypothetical protein